MRTPLDVGFRQPAEWARHAAVWVAWPGHPELWLEALPDAQHEFAAMCEAIADPDPRTRTPRGEALQVLVRDETSEAQARAALGALGATFHRASYGDIWLRDTAPVFLLDGNGMLGSVRFTFNGWGGKYDLPGDRELAGAIQGLVVDARAFGSSLIAEGGGLEVDGEGTLLTTRQCMLNPNRNSSLSQSEIERALCEALGVDKVLWLEEGLLHDHTDGHVDTLARFVAPGVVVCMAPSGEDDPNAAVLERIARDLTAMTDARGRRLEVVRIPSPGLVTDDEGEVMPASHVNFYVANTTVVVPTYGTHWDDAVVEALVPLFPSHRVVGRSARTILEGGGAFHCITQQEPAENGP